MNKRDRAILDDLERFKVMTRDQIIELHFANLSNPTAGANAVMLRLYRQGYVERTADYGFSNQYAYLPQESNIRKDSAKLRHYLAIVDVYISMLKYGEVKTFIPEPKYAQGLAEPDAFAIWKGSPFFIEVQRTQISNAEIRRKVRRYKALYDSGIIAKEPWQVNVNKSLFPAVIIVTNNRYMIESESRIRFEQVRNVGELIPKKEKPRKNTEGIRLKLA